MATVERIRELVHGPLDVQDLRQGEDAVWKLTALEWERQVEVAELQPPKALEEGWPCSVTSRVCVKPAG
jgi:hypothetical protein